MIDLDADQDLLDELMQLWAQPSSAARTQHLERLLSEADAQGLIHSAIFARTYLAADLMVADIGGDLTPVLGLFAMSIAAVRGEDSEAERQFTLAQAQPRASYVVNDTFAEAIEWYTNRGLYDEALALYERATPETEGRSWAGLQIMTAPAALRAGHAELAAQLYGYVAQHACVLLHHLQAAGRGAERVPGLDGCVDDLLTHYREVAEGTARTLDRVDKMDVAVRRLHAFWDRFGPASTASSSAEPGSAHKGNPAH